MFKKYLKSNFKLSNHSTNLIWLWQIPVDQAYTIYFQSYRANAACDLRRKYEKGIKCNLSKAYKLSSSQIIMIVPTCKKPWIPLFWDISSIGSVFVTLSLGCFHTSLCDLPRSFAIQLWQLWQFVGSFLRKAAVKKILGIEDSHWNPQATSAEMGGGRFEDLSKSLNPTYQFWVSILYISQNFIKNTVDSRWNTIACSEHLPIYR